MLLDRTPNDEQIRQRAAEMLDELRSAQFEVVLIPAEDEKHSGHRLRALQFANPEWYSRLCAQYQSIRGRGRKRYKRPRTFINRTYTLATLERIAAGDDLARRLYRSSKRIYPGRTVERDAPGGPGF